MLGGQKSERPPRPLLFIRREVYGTFIMEMAEVAGSQNDKSSYPILRFFLGERVHPNGKTIHEILNLSAPQIGPTGGIIQWLFPLTRPSTHVPSAPTLTPYELNQFRVDPKLRELYMIGVNRFLEKFAISVNGRTGSIAADWRTNKKWKFPSYHAFMPITRILRSMKLLGFTEESVTLMKLLLLCHKRGGGDVIDKVTLDAWKHL